MKKRVRVVSEKQEDGESKYKSSEFLYSVCLEDYNRVLSNYDKIYDRVNIALALCGAILVVILNNFDITVMFNWCSNVPLKKLAIFLYLLLSGASAVIIIVAVVRFLLLSMSKELLSFDSNSIKDEALYEEKVDDVALWVTLQYIKVINDIRQKTKEKQMSFNISTVLVIVSLLSYVFSKLIYAGGKL